jgi:hypothetical protein
MLLSRNKVGAVFIWCLPCLLGSVLFFFSFPIDRRIPFWPHLMIVDIFFRWFLFVTPLATVIAFVLFMRRGQAGGIDRFNRKLIWVTVIISLIVNAVMLFAIWGAIYF